MLRICRYQETSGQPMAALYEDGRAIALASLFDAWPGKAAWPAAPADWGDSLAFLPHGAHAALARDLWTYYQAQGAGRRHALGTGGAVWLPPVPTPRKFLLLAGNYAEHLEESGHRAEERSRTFPYVFSKPPSTTLIGHEAAIRLPAIAPDHVDWEAELAVVIGRRASAVAAADARSFVAGYTVVNDISQREFRPNPGRADRPNNRFFDWLHGKCFDTFAPAGPCVASADDLTDPQSLRLQLRVNGVTRQDSSTGRMIFGIAEIIEFISSFITLEPGDLISTGTPSGVGAPQGLFLSAGDVVEAEIQSIGLLRNPVVAAS